VARLTRKINNLKTILCLVSFLKGKDVGNAYCHIMPERRC